MNLASFLILQTRLEKTISTLLRYLLQTAVVLFVDWKDGEKALELIKEVLK